MASETFPIAEIRFARSVLTVENADRFIEKLRALLESDDNLTPAGLAVAAGLDKSAVRKLLSGGHSARISTAEKICKALGTTLPEFMSSDDSSNRSEIARLYSQLSPDEQRILLAAARNMAAPKQAD